MTSPLIALICTVESEASPVADQLERRVDLTIGRKHAIEGTLAGERIILLAAGMGKTNAAHGLTALLETRPVIGVVGFGIAGAYPAASLAAGEVALATAEIYGDEGVAAPEGWLSSREIGIPLIDSARDPVYNRVDLDAALVGRAAAALAREGIACRRGAFLTVSTCSGTMARGTELFARFGALCETMEGAAYAHVSTLYGVPFVEVRGVSNQVEDRDLTRWRIGEAAAAAAHAVAAIVRNGTFSSAKAAESQAE